MLRQYRLFTTGCLLLLFAGACQPLQPLTANDSPVQATYTPRYEPAPCQYELSEGDNVACGYLLVPEDRTDPASPTIRVHVLNFKAESANPAPDPVILVPGGPGAPTRFYIYLMNETPLGAALRTDRDTLLIEHRGANLSEPAFYCPELEADLSMLTGLSLAEEIAWSTEAYRTCYTRLAAEGHNLSLYGPVEAAADIADLRLALGYDEVNIYSQSWGTVLTFYLLHDHPAGLRSVIFDSPLPSDVNQTRHLLLAADEVLNAIGSACAADTACHTAYPDLEAVFYATLARLRREPVTVTVQDESGVSYEVLLDEQKFLTYVLALGQFGSDFGRIPAGMMTVHNNDYQTPAAGWLAFLAGRHGASAPGTWAAATGLYHIDSCLQESATGTVAEAVAAYEQANVDISLHDWATQLYIHDFLGRCETWPLTPAPGSAIGAEVTSDVPTLILVNTFDQWTPPFFTDTTVERFAQSYRFALPFAHLSVLSPCGAELTTQFLTNPIQAPDTGCIATMQSEWVLPEESDQ